ncbi:MAG: FecR family protein [Steroidobacter sp.]
MHIDLVETRIRRECRRWLALVNSDDASEADHERLRAWLAQSSQHRAAFEKLQALWNDIGGLHELADLEPVPTMVDEHRGHGRAHTLQRWGLAAATIAGVAVFATWTRLDSPAETTRSSIDASVPREHTTSVAEIRTIALPDGSTVTLGAQSRAIVEIAATERRVRLVDGQAFFAVAKDPQKPFVVTARNAVVRVIGTAFDVHSGPEHVRIVVAEGVVGVEARELGADEPMARLTARRQVLVAADGTLGAVESVAEAQIGAWRTGRLAYENADLREIVADLNRYGRSIELGSSGVDALRVTAAFRVDQIDSFVASLPSILPVSLERNEAGQLVVHERNGSLPHPTPAD